MKLHTRLAAAAVLVAIGFPSAVTAQTGGRNPFAWYIGGTGGVMVFETPRQESGAIPMAGANLLITARRTALLLSVEEGFGSNELTSYIDPSAAAGGGLRDVTFNDIRRYSAALLAYPLKSHAQPYLGVGFALTTTVNPQPVGPFTTPDERANAQATAGDLGSYGALTFLAGLQLQVGGLAVFGQYQIVTGASAQKLYQGPIHTFAGGLRVSLGGAKEGITGGGY